MPARWRLFDSLEVIQAGKPHLNRLRIVETPWFGIFLHLIQQPDLQRDPHNHPWWFASLTLTGEYTEAVWHPDKRWPCPEVRELRYHKRWTLTALARKDAHRITETRGPLWTLVIVGPHRESWGFWTANGFAPWRQYLGRPTGENEGQVTEDQALWS